MLALSVGTAFAGDAVVHLDYQAGASCPRASDLVDEVRARTERVRFVDATDQGRPIRIRALEEGDHAVGRIRIGTAVEAERVVTGRTCAEVVSALALIAALSLDPAVALRVTPPATAPMAAHDASPSGSGQADATVSSPFTPAPPSRSGWFAGVGASAEVSRGIGASPIALTGGSLFVEAGVATDGYFRPALRLGAVASTSTLVHPDASPGSGAATFRLIAGRVSACPFEFGRQASWIVRPCAGFELGQLTGSGRTIENGSVTVPSTGSMLRLAVSERLEGRVHLAGPAWLEMDVFASEPLLRRSFVFYAPDVTVASVSTVELGGAIGLGVHFP